MINQNLLIGGASQAEVEGGEYPREYLDLGGGGAVVNKRHVIRHGEGPLHARRRGGAGERRDGATSHGTCTTIRAFFSLFSLSTRLPWRRRSLLFFGVVLSHDTPPSPLPPPPPIALLFPSLSLSPRSSW